MLTYIFFSADSRNVVPPVCLPHPLYIFLILLWLLNCSCSGLSLVRLPDGRADGIYHTIKKNQTLWRICQTYNVDLQEVAEINNIRDTSDIKAGDKIFIPGAHKVMYVPPASTNKSSPPSSQAPRQTITSKKGLFQWPLRGKIIKTFGVHNGRKHDGIDIKGSLGEKITAARSGKVVFSAYLKGYGNTIIMEHSQKYATVYANNRENIARKGSWIKKGEVVATVGTSNGTGSTPYLHFPIRRYNKPRNPLFYLP